MPGVPRELAEHALNIDPRARPIQQPLRRFSEPNRKAMLAEIHRLQEAGFIKEVKEATWVANPVMVPKKHAEILRMCVDFTPLNKHYPKDHFPLPRIDQIIELTAGCERLSFLDAYSGYNQIRLKVEDEHTAFTMPYGVFCYQTMPFGLKNAGATYQHMMQKCLLTQIGKNVQVYINDVVITMKNESSLLDDLRETFDNLNRFRIKLNPKKMLFWCSCRRASWIPGISKGHRSKPRENPGDLINGETRQPPRSPTTGRPRRSPQQIHKPTRREGASILSVAKKIKQFRVDKRGRNSI